MNVSAAPLLAELRAPEVAPYTVLRPKAPRAPLLFASPHSGRDYPAAFLAAARLDAMALRRSEDSFVEELFAAAPAHGAPLIHAHFPRAYVDVNRERWELDPTMFAGPLPAHVNAASARVAAGLGTIPRVVATGEPIYRGKLDFAEAESRIAGCWQPYHDALAALIGETRARFGCCLLVDCHSMPSHAAGHGLQRRQPDMVLGDLHGTACAPVATLRIESELAGMGYAVRRNDPYAGGFVTRHYGRPREGVHVLQLEISRPLYMDEARIERGPGLGALQRNLARLIARLMEMDWRTLAP